ncbi:MAG: SUMF1/EgtB/PvdO family nonheme iron enzyme [Deltaproteobacteria bacterium]|nr:SUMF1/EgtB/PvdO family nonheme iron enzyme [Deltaproteobacteria bacterium]
MKRFLEVFLIVALGIIVVGCASLDSPLDSTKAITEFKFATPAATGIINVTAHTIAVEVPFGTYLTSLTPTITYAGKSISPESGVAQNFSSPVIYTVTAADGSTQTYTVTVTPGLNPDKAITEFNFATPAATGIISEEDHKISIIVPHNTILTLLTPTIIHTGKSISPVGAQDFSVPVTYTVTAEDGSKQDYEVTVTPASADAKAITRFSFATPAATGIINETAHTIVVKVPSDANLTSLVASFITTGASVKIDSTVQISGTTANKFADPVTYTVTDANGVTQDYTVTVTKWGQFSDIEPMIAVPGGTFQRDAAPANTSTVTGFYMSKAEITRNQFYYVTGLDPSDLIYSSGSESDPVQKVSWYDALVFCNKLSILKGLTPVYKISGSTDPADWGPVPTSSNATWNAVIADGHAKGYRLPTEMEWMWAAMGATSGSGYTGGTYTSGYQKEFAGDPNPTTSGDLIEGYAWTSENSDAKTHPAETRLANELGLYDMSGNVLEWCWDWYADNGTPPNYAITGAVTDYPGPASGGTRVLRGGSFAYSASNAAVARRGQASPYDQYEFMGFGFRVVRNL